MQALSAKSIMFQFEKSGRANISRPQSSHLLTTLV
jgi:hypothetical protein